MEHPQANAAEPSRRGFLGLLTWVTGGVAGLLFTIPVLGFFVGALRKRQTQWVPLGNLGDFAVGQTRRVSFVNPLKQPWDGMVANSVVYVRNLGPVAGEQRLQVFAANCAHLGCPVTWFPQSGLFMCPCHGGVYYEDGERASGPPPRGLFHCPWRIHKGQVEIQAPHMPTLQDPLEKTDR
jgi:menaquinol-cytochrome c reductase iron-sulfur subunit